MRLLLDENLPKRLKLDFAEHEIFTVRDRQWNGVRNGELLKLMLDNGFEALLTYDKNLQHQQNFVIYQPLINWTDFRKQFDSFVPVDFQR